jgi:ESCRT-I complex subunit VPS28
VLAYFTAEGGAPRGRIDLHCATISPVPRWGIVIEGPWAARKFHLEAPSEEAHGQWLAALSAVVATFQDGPVPTAPDGDAHYPRLAALGVRPPLPEVSDEELCAGLARLGPGSPSTGSPILARQQMDDLAELFSLIKTLDHLERMHARDGLDQGAYARACAVLLTQYAAHQPMVQDAIGTLPIFLKQYRLSAPFAELRLAAGAPSSVSLHGGGVGGGGPSSVDGGQVLDLVQHLLTLQDALKLGQRAADQLQPLVHAASDLLQQFGPSGPVPLRGWLLRLNAMKASEELTGAEASELAADAQAAYDSAHRTLQGR